MKIRRTRYQQGSIRKVQLAHGYVWEWRYRETTADGSRRLRAIRFDGDEYPTEALVLKAIEMKKTLLNSDSGRAKVGARFGVIIDIYRKEHLPTLRHSTRQMNTYLLENYIEPRWTGELIGDVTPLAITSWIRELHSVCKPAKPLSPSSRANLRSLLRQCFELAALHQFIPPNERNPVSLVRIKGTGSRQKEVRSLTPGEFRKLLRALPQPVNLMVLIAASLGLRVGEVALLSTTDRQRHLSHMAVKRQLGRSREPWGLTEISLPIVPP